MAARRSLRMCTLSARTWIILRTSSMLPELSRVSASSDITASSKTSIPTMEGGSPTLVWLRSTATTSASLSNSRFSTCGCTRVIISSSMGSFAGTFGTKRRRDSATVFFRGRGGAAKWIAASRSRRLHKLRLRVKRTRLWRWRMREPISSLANAAGFSRATGPSRFRGLSRRAGSLSMLQTYGFCSRIGWLKSTGTARRRRLGASVRARRGGRSQTRKRFCNQSFVSRQISCRKEWCCTRARRGASHSKGARSGRHGCCRLPQSTAFARAHQRMAQPQRGKRRLRRARMPFQIRLCLHSL
mmetsp:Transcript_19314/g.62833  ORF Transcript_19314/g.62833 Transcript_19314/m.62833 type:complete len:300 (+) Transcript_19314:2376-3275(+)